MTTPQVTTPATSTEAVVEAFVNGDCYFLALALVEHNPNLRVGILREANGDWIHGFAYDPATNEFIDVTGRQSEDDFLDEWEWAEWETWTDHSPTEAQDMFKSVTRVHPEVDIQDGLRIASENGA